MRKRGTWLLAACTALAIAGTPALAQQSGQGGGMMGKGGPDQGGGMMGKGGPRHGGGMMGGGMGKGKDQCPKMGGMMRGGMMGKGMMGKGMMHSRPMMEARLAYIKADLDITDAQTDAWNAYADAVRSGHSAMESAREDMMKASESGNAVERMDARIEVAQAKLDNLKALKPATETLYDALTDDQKKKADGLLNRVCGRM